MAEVEIRNVHKSYGDHSIIKGVSITGHDGEFVVLVGPSGCGKSTLLRMIAGLESINAGEIAIGGKVVNDLPPKERDIAMVFQNYALYPHMTVAQNMAFSLKLRGASKREMQEKIDRAADILGLATLLERYPRELSGGQRQRVAMGRALVRDPRVFLFDEPLSNLDSKLRVQMRTEIKLLHRQLKTTTVYVTHDQIEAMTMADRIVVMNRGQVEQIGAPLELYDRPANRFVAGFIGSPGMNFLNATVRGDSSGWFATFAAGARIALSANTAWRDGLEIVVGIRPEHLQRVHGESSPGDLSVRIASSEPTGSETLAHAVRGNEPVVFVTKERLNANPGDELRLRAAQANLHAFDRGAGQRVN